MINKVIPLVTSLGLATLGFPLLIGGLSLVLLNGSYYYLIAGTTLLVSAMLAWRCNPLAVWLYLALTMATIVWALLEVGLDCWALLPRISLLSVVGLWFALPIVRKIFHQNGQISNYRSEYAISLGGPILFSVAVFLCITAYNQNAFVPIISQFNKTAINSIVRDSGSWSLYGNTERGDRFSSADLINASNVKNLELAWQFRTGIREQFNTPEEQSLGFQATPIKVNKYLYLCTPYNLIISLDADTGEEQWRFDPKVSDAYKGFPCRGVSHYAGTGTEGFCDQRVLMTAADNRLLAVDLKTGKPCSDFGVEGSVDLTVGMGENLPQYQYATSPPIVIGDTVVLGGAHADNQSTDEPPGVIRAFDARSGQLLWVWEVLEENPRKPLQAGGTYARNTPNAWSIFSADTELGLVYIPTGNTPPDYFGGLRTPAQDRYSSSIVALDVATGAVRWNFQTVHHDLWDLDIAAQPVLVDIDTPQGKRAALIAPTKRGEIFLLDRRTGEPLLPVVEKPVPQGTVKEEWLSPTQPYQPDFPSFAPSDLTEEAMWGATLVDQMMCRIKFRQHRYEGQFTPPSLQGTIAYPSFYGVINWGSVAVDPERQIMIVNSSKLPFMSTLIPRHEADALGVKPLGVKNTDANQHANPGKEGLSIWPQAGTPYAVKTPPFLSPLGFPCHQPPWGMIAAVDLTTKKILWQRPFGTSRDAAPMGLPLPIGVFNQGGAVVTRGGLTFIGAAMDNYLRAYHIETGEELWKARLPAGGQATPMSYVSERTGRQYVVIAAGGHAGLQTQEGDYLMAYALPERLSSLEMVNE